MVAWLIVNQHVRVRVPPSEPRQPREAGSAWACGANGSMSGLQPDEGERPSG